MQHSISAHKIQLPGIHSYTAEASLATTLTHKFIAWCNLQEKNWFLWLAIALVGSIGTVLPLTLISIVFGAGNNFTLWVIASIVNVPILVVYLAVQPAIVKLPVLFFAWMVDAIIITYCLVLFFMN